MKLYLTNSITSITRGQDFIEVKRITKGDEQDLGQPFIEKVLGLKNLFVKVDLEFIASGNFDNISDSQIKDAIYNQIKELCVESPAQ